METFEPKTVSLLASVTDSVVKALEQETRVMPPEQKKAIAIRVMELFCNGVSDPDKLLLEVMADNMFAPGLVSDQSRADPI